MTRNKKAPYTFSVKSYGKPIEIKKWAIKKLKQGYSPNRIAQDIKLLFEQSVTMVTVYRWKKRYIEATGFDIPGWCKLNPTPEQKKNNKVISPSKC